MYPKELEMTIEVTQDDIDLGERGDPDHCAIAGALRRRFDCLITVGSSSFWIDEFWGRWPRHIHDFVVHFDCGERVKPFSFRLPKLHPRASLKREWEQERKAVLNPSPEAIAACLASLSASHDKPSDVLISS